MAARRTALSALLFILVQMALAVFSADVKKLEAQRELKKAPSLMRRVGRHGEPSSDASGSAEMPKTNEGFEIKQRRDLLNQSTGNPASWCNTYYPRGEWRTNTCTSGEHVATLEECRHAAMALNYSVASDFETNEYQQNPLPRPHACFVYHHIVYFNPSGDTVPDTVPEGTPICKDRIYTQGGHLGGYLTHITESDLCPPEYKLVDNWEECEWAHDCEYGGMYCEEANGVGSHHATTERTPGCYRNAIGCFGFNNNTIADMNASWYVNSTPVCVLETYQFAGHPKYMTFTQAPTPAPAPPR